MFHMKLVIFILALVGIAQSSYHEEELYNYLFSKSNFTSSVRPVVNDTDTVVVTLNLNLFQILDVQEKDEMMVTSIFVTQTWYNPLMTWNPSDYNGIESINVEPGMIWKPDIVLYNSVDDDKYFGANFDRLKTRVEIYHDGSSKWMAPIIIKSKCDINVKYFPYDRQRCPLIFGSWTYDEKRLNLTLGHSGADTSEYMKNSEFRLNDALGNWKSKQYPCCKDKKYPTVTYIIDISRRTLFYQFNLVFPMVVIGMLTLCSFLLPAESGERMGLALTLLLSMTVFMLLIADMIPATSDVVPLVGLFFKATMVEMIIMIVALCLMMKLYHKSSNDQPVPHWMRSYIVDYLSYIVRVRVRETNRNDAEKNHVLVGIDNSDESNLLINHEKKNHKQVVVGPETGAIIKRLDVITNKLNNMDNENAIINEWKIVANTLDRCLLILFLISYILIVAAFLLSAPEYVP